MIQYGHIGIGGMIPVIKKFVLWGHHLKDYKEMFDLVESDLQRKIVEFGAGVTSFNLEMQQLGHHVTSCDHLFSMSKKALASYVDDIFDTTVNKMKANESEYNWKSHASLTELIEMRRQGIDAFFKDYEIGKADKRYMPITNNAPLPFDDFNFGLALITHHLFVNYDDKALEEHVSIIQEMIRIAGEVRIFPLLDKFGRISPLLGPVMLALQQSNLGVEVRQVDSQLQKAGNAMLRVWALKCDVSEPGE
jgi:uncharacterized UPF0146 family protein